MRRWTIFAAAGAVILTAGGWVGWRFLRDPTTLLGGVALSYEVDAAHPYDEGSPREQVLARTVEVLRGRVAKMASLGRVVAEDDRVVVRLPGQGREIERLKAVLVRSARLELKRIDDDCPLVSGTFRQIGPEGLPGVRVVDRRYGAQNWRDWYLEADSDTTLAAAVAGLQAKRPLLPDRQIVLEHVQEDGQLHWRTHCVFRRPDATDADIVDAEPEFDDKTGRVDVAVQFTSAGAKRLEEATRAWIDRRFAFLLDGRVLLAPVINSVISERALINLGAAAAVERREDARDLITILRIGSLPAPLRLVEERRIDRHH